MKLIINADDFGLTSGVNSAIRDCFLAGSVTSTTLMVNTPATLEAVKLAKSHPALGVGLHFNLTLGQPLSPAKEILSLVDAGGYFPGRGVCERNLLFGRVKRADIEREFHTQVERFTSFGLPLTHIDSHQHIHLFPQVFDIVAEYCAKHQIPLRLPWVWSGCRGVIPLKKRVRSLLLRLLVRRNARRWKGRIVTNQSFGSIFDLTSTPEGISQQTYLRLLEGAGKPPFELMVHPAIVDAKLRAMTRITDYSAAEYRLLLNPGFATELRVMGYQLVTYRDLLPIAN